LFTLLTLNDLLLLKVHQEMNSLYWL